MDTFELKVITPAGVALKEVVTSAILPGLDGEIGVLPKHCNYITLIAEGTLRYTTSKGDTREIEVAEGSCQYQDDVLTILAEGTK